MSFPTFVTFNQPNGQAYSSYVMYNSNTNNIYPLKDLRSFDDVVRLLSNKEIASFNINTGENFKDQFGNIIMTFLDHNKNLWHTVVQYNNKTNEINPPISFVF